MALETFTYITSLQPANPTSTDPVSQGDDHLRGIKTTLVNSFPNISAPVLATAAQIDAAAINPAPTVPVGMILDWAGGTVPANYLALPTTATNVSRTTYAALFSAIGTTWGPGNGTTTFGMPYVPVNYPTIHAPGFTGLPSVGEVIAHAHDFTAQQNIGGYTDDGGAPDQRSTSQVRTTTTVGGSANLPAGQRMVKVIRYQ